jgi:hypothetical protein
MLAADIATKGGWDEWKIRNNLELRNMYGQPKIIGDWMVRTCGKDGGGANGEKDI